MAKARLEPSKERASNIFDVMQPTFAGQDGPVGSVVVGIDGAFSPAPGFPFWGIVHCDTYCCTMQMLLIGRRGAIHPLAGLHVACWYTSEACLSYYIPEQAPLLSVMPHVVRAAILTGRYIAVTSLSFHTQHMVAFAISKHTCSCLHSFGAKKL